MSNLQNETYLGNSQVKRDGIQQQWSKHEILEYQKCMADPIYFVENYVKIIQLDRGLVKFEAYPYQKKMFKSFNENRFNIVLACRQSGKSISACAYLLWYVLFNPEKTVAILANKGETAREMLSRITLMLENIPFFLQPGCKVLNKGSLEFSNNSRVVARATSGSSIRGLSVNLLYLDEFAFVERAAEFYTSTYPVISSGKETKVIITSTANGLGNTYHKLWEGAVQKTNEFVPFRVDWDDVPGRDEAWKAQTISNTSQLQFDQEFGNTFFGTADTLIGAESLMNLRAHSPVSILENGSCLIYEKTQPKHEYIMTVDVSKGRGQDYSTLSVIDITSKPFKQVAVYRNNNISPLLFPNIIYKYATSYNNAYVVIESNDQGSVVCNGLYHELEYENVHVRSQIKADSIGVEMNRKIKRLGCSAIKELIEQNKVIVTDEQTIIEMSTFVGRGQSYEASSGNHDDLMMTLVMFGYFVTTERFADMTDINLKDMLYDKQAREIDDDMVPFGFIDDGADHMTQMDQRERMEKEGWSISWGDVDKRGY
jgi:hypothetical protein